MANTYTPIYNLAKPAQGDLNWDDELNTNMDTIDSALRTIATALETKMTTATWDSDSNTRVDAADSATYSTHADSASESTHATSATYSTHADSAAISDSVDNIHFKVDSGGISWALSTATATFTLLNNHTQGTDTTLGAMTANIDMNSHKIINVADPTSAQDVATKNYVDTHGVALDQVVLGSQIFG